ncbi:MAG TPA: TrkH family potassium uptake protein [Candidatus Jeotgalicoccus stercoravium]|nr:TrkH family potassium uptake protein [Candidatus Jeotgalicoccus stercoravium]
MIGDRRVKELRRKLGEMSPQRAILLYYLLALILATILLSLPIFYSDGTISLIDTVFLAASALSVTGLSTVTLVETFNLSGYILIMFLMNLGGIGIMAVGTLVWVLLGRKISVRERRQIITDNAQYKMSGAVRLVMDIFFLLIIVEIIGALIYISYFYFSTGDLGYSVLHGTFLSVSATTNGGLDLYNNSLTHQAGNLIIQIPVMCQIILGAIGYPVLIEVKEFFNRRKRSFRFSLFTKVTVVTHAALLVLGTIFIFVLEYGKLFKNEGLLYSLTTSMFMSTTTRSGGITVVYVDQLQEATHLIMSMLMFIGASPSSAGGGIRTTTFAILILFMITFARSRAHINVFSKRISKLDIERAFAVFVLAMGLVFFGMLSILVIDGDKFTVTQIIFEVCSAFGTVGISTGITEELSSVSKIIIIVFMFIGRIGFVSFLLSISGKKKELTFKYPEERLMVG